MVPCREGFRRSASPPTNICSVPASAAGIPPPTGASSTPIRRASAATQPHPLELSSHGPGRDHVTGPDQIRAHGLPHPAHPDETYPHAQRFPARDDTHLSNETPRACAA
jgi:hypothetical protein